MSEVKDTRTSRPKTVGDITLHPDLLDHMTKNPLIRFFLLELMSDFNVNYVDLMAQKIEDDETEADIQLRQNMKTELFQAYCAGVMNARNDDSEFGKKWNLHHQPKEKSKLIL